MSYVLLNADIVEAIHDAVLNPGELAGRALDKSLDGALARVDNRLVYGLIEDIFDLAAAYCVAVATGHVFNDANKRTSYKTMIVCLHLNGVRIAHETVEAGDLIREVAQRRIAEETLADRLRAKAT
ncbi:Toxin Doc [Sulfitobacter indolifex]|uniref:Death-on-curing protein n=1 Tax=Sulfitobacter indolifex HEL-45 TaxID=391624 RepID=A0ABP2DBJ8_9RHOB|nr:type II toxin-antitoxin system death-on-curing family toxin [Sulfitobacter indolifex]EDQ05138.1 death-on-curing protein [Sulfitobacter indolifex HEL-45]UOA18186.1 Toxin Doc [Sulfitobacter indolifex]